jgi:hypothetical protein
MGFAFQCLLSVLRLVLPAWIGAAVLFAINGSAEQRNESFDSVTRAELALLRFPDYYRFGFVCVGSALGITAILLLFRSNVRRRLAFALAILTGAMLLMVWDFEFIYGPMHTMIVDPTQPKPSTWVRLHATSMITNLVHVSLCLIAAIVVCWPGPDAIRAGQSLPLQPDA